MKLRKLKISLKIFLIIVLLLGGMTVKSFALVEQSTEFYVNDTANLLDSDVENYIIETNKKLNAATGAQIVVVTVNNLEGQSLEEYATALFRKYGIGDSKKNNGVLLLLALEEREFRIEVGYGLEGVLNDAKTGRIQDGYIIPYLKDDNWNEGVRNGYSKVLEEVSNEYGVDVGEINAVEVDGEANIVSSIMSFVIIIGCPVIFGLGKKVRIGVLIVDIIAILVTIVLAGTIKNSVFDSMVGGIFAFEGITLMMCIISFITTKFGGRGGFFIGGGGFSGGRRRRFFWRRRFIWWRRFFKRILKNGTVYHLQNDNCLS